MKTIPELQKEVHANAIAKGWYEKEKSVPEHLALIHSEVSELYTSNRTGIFEQNKIERSMASRARKNIH